MAMYDNSVTVTNAMSPYDIQNDEDLVEVDSSAGPVTVNLPLAVDVDSKLITIKDVGGAAMANNITIGRQGGEAIDGVLSDLIMNTNKRAVNLYSHGAEFRIKSVLV